MAARGDEKKGTQGGQDVELSPSERAAFDQLAAGAQDTNQGGYTRRYSPGNNVYDNNSGYTRRYGDENNAGYTRRDQNEHAGYTKRDKDQHGGYTRRYGDKKGLKEAEEGGDKQSKGERLKGLAANGLLGAEKKGDAETPFAYSGGEKKGKGKLGGLLAKHKKKIAAASLAGIGILPLVALLLFLLGTLKIPHFVENMAAWRLAKVTNQYRKSMNNVVGAKNGLDSLDDEGKAKAQAKYGKFKVFDGINRLRPNKVLQGLQANERIQYNYKTTLTGKQKLTSITIAEGGDPSKKITYDLPSGRFDKLRHPLRTLDQYKTVSTALNVAMKAYDIKIPTVVRSAATKNVIKKAGGTLRGMVASRYLAKDNTKTIADISKQLDDLDTELDDLEEKQDRLSARSVEANKATQEAYKKAQDLNQRWSGVHAQLQATDPKDPDWASKVLKLFIEWDDITAELDDVNARIPELQGAGHAIATERINTSRKMLDLFDRRAILQENLGKVGAARLSDRDAKIAIQREVYEGTKDNGGIAGLTSEESRKLAEEVDRATDEAVGNDEKLGTSVDKGNDIPDEVLDVAEKGTDPGRIKAVTDKIIGFANPVYDIAVPVCMMYDGSKLTAESLDSQQNAVMREALFMLAVGDQQKAGSKFTTVMSGAINWKAGNVQNSNVIRRLSGKPTDTTQGLGGPRTTLGTYGKYTIFDALTGGNGGPFNAIADQLCPVATNVWVGVSLGVVNIVVTAVGSILSGGAVGAAEQGATQAVREAITKGITRVTTKKISEFTLKKGIKSFAKAGRFGGRYLRDVAKYGAAEAGATYVARMIVMSKAGTMTSGLETQGSWLDNIDNGAEALSDETGRANYRGRPQTLVEMVQNHKVDRAELGAYNQTKSTFDRYMALENPNSFVSRLAITTGSLVNKSFFASILNGTANLFNPIGLGSRMFASANDQAVMAAVTANTEDYGLISWQYSVEEQRLMDQDSYASPPENSFILDQSAKEDAINSKYDKCYTKTVGQLLTDGDIQRDETGEVLNEGDCSPLQLGPHNPDYGDLVFRWRLKHNYENTTDLLLGIQDPGKPGVSTLTPNGTLPSGTTQELARQIVNNPNITFQDEPTQRQAMEYIAQTGHARDCGGPAVNPKVLSVLLAAAQKYKIVIGVVVDGHKCDGLNHPKGWAVDLNGINPLTGPGGTNRNITEANYHDLPIMKEFYTDMANWLAQAGGGRLGQINCFQGAPPANVAGVRYISDDCSHLHIDIET